MAFCFILELKITLYFTYSHSFSFVLSLFVIRCHSLSFCCYSLSFVATRCYSLSLVFICCHLLYHSLSFVLPLVVIRFTTRCHSLYHSLSFVVTHSTTRCHSMFHSSVFYKRSFIKGTTISSFPVQSLLQAKQLQKSKFLMAYSTELLKSISNISQSSCFNTLFKRKTNQFTRIHTNSLINIEKILNRPVTKFYNRDDVNMIAAELQLTKTRSTSFYKKHNLL